LGEAGKSLSALFSLIIGAGVGGYIGYLFYTDQVYGVYTEDYMSIAIGVVSALALAFMVYRGLHPR